MSRSTIVSRIGAGRVAIAASSSVALVPNRADSGASASISPCRAYSATSESSTAARAVVRFLAQPFVRGPMNDAQNPYASVEIGILANPAERAEASSVDDVLRFGSIVDEPACKSVSVVEMRQHDFLERRTVLPQAGGGRALRATDERFPVKLWRNSKLFTRSPQS